MLQTLFLMLQEVVRDGRYRFDQNSEAMLEVVCKGHTLGHTHTQNAVQHAARPCCIPQLLASSLPHKWFVHDSKVIHSFPLPPAVFPPAGEFWWHESLRSLPT